MLERRFVCGFGAYNAAEFAATEECMLRCRLRGSLITVSHTTIHRWVIRHVPEFEKRWHRFARPVNMFWRVDETCNKVRGKWNYLYRAVDKHGKTADFLLRPDRGVAAAQAFFH
jgi:transposase-like protein